MTGAASDVPIRNLQAQVQIPYDPALAGKTLKLQVGMSVHYPSAAGMQMDYKKWQMADTFKNKSATMSTSLVVRLAERGQRRGYQEAWKNGAMVGSLAYLFGGGILVLLAWSRLQRPRRDPLFSVRLSVLRSLAGASG